MRTLAIIFFIAAIAEPEGPTFSITAWLLRFAVCMTLATLCAVKAEHDDAKRRKAKRKRAQKKSTRRSECKS